MNFNPLPIFLAAVGTYLLIKLRFFYILHPIRTLRRGLRAIKGKQARRSFSLALAGTLGVGNVFGVAIGIIIGGAGSLFWLLVSMLFAMVIKYSEVVLASDNLHHDTDTHGGMAYVLASTGRRFGRPLSILYSACVLVISLVMGGALQSDAIVKSAEASVRTSPHLIAFILVILALISIIGGAARIERITAIIIPLTTIIYIIITSSIIFVNASEFSRVIFDVLNSAFSARSAVGGILGFLMCAPLREGFARGILSNEAGAGTSAMAHSRSGLLSPCSAGILGIFEVWFDTGLICMLTGFSILLSVPDPTVFADGMQLVAYSVGNLFGTGGKYLLLLSVFAFAFATIICWYYYGSEAWSTLFGQRKRAAFLPLFLFSVYLGCFADTTLLITLTDLLMLLAGMLTLFAIVKSSDRIRELSELGGVINSETGRLRRLRVRGIKEILSRKERRRR